MAKYSIKDVELWAEEYKRRKGKRGKNKPRTDTKYIIGRNIRNAIKCKRKTKPIENLGHYTKELIIHLEKQFYDHPKTGIQMAWENYGKKGWYVVCIKPFKFLDSTSTEQYLETYHYTNLQPLWAEDYYIKRSKNIKFKRYEYLIRDVKLWAEEYKKCYSFAEVGRAFGVAEGTVRHSLIVRHKYYLNIQTLDEYQDELAEQGLKKCLGPHSCKEIKPFNEFEFRYDSNNYRQNCKKCLKESKRESKRKYRQTTEYKLRKTLRGRLREAIRNRKKVGSAVKDLGCSLGELKKHLEKQFYPNLKTKEQMAWENYGYGGWHIDHIVPLAIFDLTDREQFLKACHYTNLQPLWADDHNIKTASDLKTIKQKKKQKQKEKGKE